jgi:hypothetical protein
MTHDRALVLVPPTIPDQEREVWGHEILFPFADYFPDQPYVAPCYCLPQNVREDAIRAANTQAGDFEKIGHAYLALPAKQRPAWRDFPATVRWQRAAERAVHSHPAFKTPDIACKYLCINGMMETLSNIPGHRFECCDLVGDGGSMDIYTAPEVPNRLDAIDPLYVVTPDGSWHEIDREAPEPDKKWHHWISEMLANYRDHLVVVAYMST